MATPTRSLFAPGKQARVSLSFSERIAERINLRCIELGCEPKDYVKYAVLRELDQTARVNLEALAEMTPEEREEAIDLACSAHFRRQ